MAAAKGKTNWFAVGISIAVVVVLVAIGGLVVFLNNQATAPGVAPEAALVNSETGAISFGDGKDVVDTYVDFMCPGCGAFEQTHAEDLQQAASDNNITLNVHPIAILDRFSQGTNFSSRAASAMYCVADVAPAAALPFMNLMFANQPAENSPGLTDEQITQIASEVGADAAADCIAAGTYMKFVADVTKNLPANPETGGGSTPTLLINGEYIQNPINAQDLPKLLRSF